MNDDDAPHENAPTPAPAQTVLLGSDRPSAPHSAPDTDALVVVAAVEPTFVGKLCRLTEGDITISREIGGDIVIPFDEAISRRHAKFVPTEKGWTCVDLGSTNGTSVNGTRIHQPTVLHPGDRITVGSTTFLYVAQQASVDALPMPLAVADSLVDAQHGVLPRVKAVVDGIDRALRFLTGVQVAALVARGDNDVIDRVADVFARVSGVRQRRKLSLGDWRVLTFGLCPLLANGTDPISLTALRLADSRVGGKRLPEVTREAIEFRNKESVGHGWIGSEEALAKHQASLREALRGLFRAAQPLCQTRLVSLARIVEMDDDTVTYDLHTHQGPREVFPVERMVLACKISKVWNHLVLDERNVVSLAPFVACTVPEGGQKLELFLAEGVTLGDKGTPVCMRAVTSSVEAKIDLPSSKGLVRLAERVHAR